MTEIRVPDEGTEVWAEALITGIAFPKHSDEPRLIGSIPSYEGDIFIGPEEQDTLRSPAYIDAYGLKGKIWHKAIMGKKALVLINNLPIGHLRLNSGTPYVDSKGKHIRISLTRGEALRSCILDTPVLSVILTLNQLLERENKKNNVPKVQWKDSPTHELSEYLNRCLKMNDEAWRKTMGKALWFFPEFGLDLKFKNRNE